MRRYVTIHQSVHGKITFPLPPANDFSKNSKSCQVSTSYPGCHGKEKNSLQTGVEMYWSARKIYVSQHPFRNNLYSSLTQTVFYTIDSSKNCYLSTNKSLNLSIKGFPPYCLLPKSCLTQLFVRAS